MMKRIGELKADLSQMTAWGRGLEHDKRLLEEENAFLRSEVERLKNNVAYLDKKLDEELDGGQS